MARKIAEIKGEITSRFMANDTLSAMYGFTLREAFDVHFSKVSIENLLIDVVSFGIWSLESVFDIHKKEVDTAIAELKPHTARWYRNKALAFQYGFDLLEDSDRFDNDGYTVQQIEASKVIKYSAVVESEEESRLIVKIATELGNELQQITPAQQEAFGAYINEIKDAGVRITVINYQPDILRLAMRIVRDPLVLDVNGTHRINGGKPVEAAINEYLKELPFNGELRLQELANKIEVVDGVAIVSIDAASSKWIDPAIGGYGDWRTIDIRVVPVSGYFQLENFNGLKYEFVV